MYADPKQRYVYGLADFRRTCSFIVSLFVVSYIRSLSSGPAAGEDVGGCPQKGEGNSGETYCRLQTYTIRPSDAQTV